MTSKRVVVFEEGAIEVPNEPFRHCVLDNWWPDELLGRVLDEFPEPASSRWHRFDNERERKSQGGWPCWGPWTRRFLFEDLAAQDWRRQVAALMAVDADLQPDVEGGGMHLIEPGGFLDVHADFNRSAAGLWRRVNVLVFLNRQWTPEDGGVLELRGDCTDCGGSGVVVEEHEPWAHERLSCQTCEGRGVDLHGEAVGIPPTWNRTVIFEASDRSWHGHPTPLPGPKCRRSIATYYFTEERPEHASAPHSTIFPR